MSDALFSAKEALKARFRLETEISARESRFQRWRFGLYESSGVAPGLTLSAAPLALNGYVQTQGRNQCCGSYLESYALGVFHRNPTAQIIRQRCIDPITAGA
jgi:hypothetical protein